VPRSEQFCNSEVTRSASVRAQASFSFLAKQARIVVIEDVALAQIDRDAADRAIGRGRRHRRSIPRRLAYAGIVGVPPIMGLYTPRLQIPGCGS
jgi:hypothetical protein